MIDLRQKIKRPVLITGCTGMLGTDLVRHFEESVGQDFVFATDSKTLDVTRLDKVKEFILDRRPSTVINAAAYTNVDGAETERDKAFLINAVGPQNLVKACAELDIPLIHFTTDYVFDGSGNRAWEETDIPNPPRPNFYAETKLWGEREVLAYSRGTVLRVQWLYGSQKDRFTILRGKEVFTPLVDQFGAPTWTREIADVVSELLLRDAKGLFHFAYDDYASWAEVFTFVREELGLSTRLIPKKSAELNLPARRPLFSVLSNRKLAKFLGRPGMGSWKKPLREFLHSRTPSSA